MITTIAFDADDTLWHNERHYAITQEKFAALLAPYCSTERVEKELYATEMRNLRLFGYGTKGFMLSMIETAIELSDGRIRGQELKEILSAGKAMLNMQIELLPFVRETLEELSTDYRLLLITKGDLFDQESKISRSGVAGYFSATEIVSDKTPQTYTSLLEKYALSPRHFLMAGNSLNSDVLPVIAIGAQAVHVPYKITWAHESPTDLLSEQNNFYTIDHLGQLPDLVRTL